MRIPDKSIIVTGAGGGIGEGIALRLAAEGARVIVADEVRCVMISSHSGATGNIGCVTNAAVVSYNSGRASGTPAAYAISQRASGVTRIRPTSRPTCSGVNGIVRW